MLRLAARAVVSSGRLQKGYIGHVTLHLLLIKNLSIADDRERVTRERAGAEHIDKFKGTGH